ncbi:LAFA_0D07030g1_1 [Lachancea sp. 'fantastica']|nr:LAFA_0D07030g1_1 [Lachancea sp. 'fantastica']
MGVPKASLKSKSTAKGNAVESRKKTAKNPASGNENREDLETGQNDSLNGNLDRNSNGKGDSDGQSEEESSGEASGEASGEDSSEDEDSSDGSVDEDEDDDFPKKKKAKLGKHNDGSSDFSTAINAILGSHLKAHDRKDPIMARKKSTAKKLESDKLEAKAKRAMLVEKKKLLNKTRTKDIIPTVSAEADSGVEIREVLEKERRLRKIAQKGVVKLFNAILSTQVKTERDGAEKLGNIKNRSEKKDMLNDLSKEKFLDLVKAAGDS